MTKKRFFQVSLWGCFLIFSISCLAAFAYARFIRTASVEANAIRSLEDLGIAVDFYYAHEVEAEARNLQQAVPPGPDWLKAIFGEMVFARVEGVALQGEIKSLDNCRMFLAELNSLKELSVNSNSLKNIDALSSLNLSCIELWSCDGLTDLNSLGNIASLDRLVIGNCDGIKELNLNGPPFLTHLQISSCGSLRKIRGRKLPSLNVVYIHNCNRLVSFDVPAENFSFSDCDGIVNLAFSHTIPALKSVRVDSCKSLISIKGLPEKVETLELVNCEALELEQENKNKLPGAKNETDAVKTESKTSE